MATPLTMQTLSKVLQAHKKHLAEILKDHEEVIIVTPPKVEWDPLIFTKHEPNGLPQQEIIDKLLLEGLKTEQELLAAMNVPDKENYLETAKLLQLKWKTNPKVTHGKVKPLPVAPMPSWTQNQMPDLVLGPGTVRIGLQSVLPGLSTWVSCPYPNCPDHSGIGSPIDDMIVILNDAHGWSREQIADWLETLDVDLTFPDPTKEKECPSPTIPKSPNSEPESTGLKNLSKQLWAKSSDMLSATTPWPTLSAKDAQ